MSKKSTRGYYVRGQFIAAGSEEDLQLKAELKGSEVSKSDKKRESDALQTLGEDLLTLRNDLLDRLMLPETLLEALAEAARISDFEGRRRQMQYVGKQMRRLDPQEVSAIREALEIQRSGSAEEKQELHTNELWRERLIASDDALEPWLAEHPGQDIQQLRSLIRQARRQEPAESPAQTSQGLAARKGKAYRELFQWIQRVRREKSEREQDMRHYNDDGSIP